MFNNLFDFGFKRNWKQAIGFYLVFLVIGFVICALAGGLAGVIVSFLNVANVQESAAKYGMISGVGTALIFSYVLLIGVLKKKNKLISLYSVLLILPALLVPFSGLLFILIIVSILTTLEIRNNESQPTNN